MKQDYSLNIIIPSDCLGEYTEFIAKYDNAMNPQVCDEIVRQFEHHSSYYFDRTLDKSGKPHRDMFTMDFTSFPDAFKFSSLIQETLTTACRDYVKLFPAAAESTLVIPTIRVQKTVPGGGYHTWHCENNSFYFSSRYITWMIYLNDVSGGGETEFLYQGVRFNPTKGTLLLWPCSYTHVHRGNPPLSQDKYILTGWFELTPQS